MKTKVIFRKTRSKKDSEIIAFFPDTLMRNTLLCYVHTGQHSDAHIDYYKHNTVKCAKSEYQDLLKELTFVGYNDIEIVNHI